VKFVVVAEIVAVLATSLVMTVDLLFTVAFATCVSQKNNHKNKQHGRDVKCHALCEINVYVTYYYYYAYFYY